MHVPDTIDGITPTGFTVTIDGKPREIRYDGITGIRIETTDRGPWLPDCFWHIDAHGCTVILENGDPVFTVAILPRLQALPGFDNAQVIKAMQSTDHDSFTVLATKGGVPSRYKLET